MTNIITRYFDDKARARAASHELVQRRRLSAKIVQVYDKADGLVEKLTEDGVEQDTARAYQQRLEKGGAVVLVLASYKPLGVAQITRDVMAEMGAADMGGLTEEVYVKDRIRPTLSILDEHPLILTSPRDPASTTYHMADWPIPLISRRKPAQNAVLESHPNFFTEPLPLTIRTKPYTKSIIGRNAHMANWPIRLISKRKPYRGSIIGRNAHMANFPIRLISRRKPWRGSLIPPHQHMANWPFPLLINGKMGQNALVPGQPHMANWPIRLISKRKPYTGSVVGRNRHMASFPIGLISKRKPYTGSVIGRHAHMANAGLPLVVRREGPEGFSFSKMMGWKTIIRK